MGSHLKYLILHFAKQITGRAGQAKEEAGMLGGWEAGRLGGWEADSQGVSWELIEYLGLPVFSFPFPSSCFALLDITYFRLSFSLS